MSPYPYFKTVIKLNEEVNLSASQICKCIETQNLFFGTDWVLVFVLYFGRCVHGSFNWLTVNSKTIA